MLGFLCGRYSSSRLSGTHVANRLVMLSHQTSYPSVTNRAPTSEASVVKMHRIISTNAPENDLAAQEASAPLCDQQRALSTHVRQK